MSNKHRCAYCGSDKTQILQTVKIERGVVWFRIFCNRCNKEDRPAVTEDQLKLFLCVPDGAA